ncbi:hypothetical protein BAUCODRAFT_88360 [Baudoinia panamericana UAMH 10762]|uniref:Small ribosomal subunit protein mS23 n=1 Tax=Baudoinia panamericana (strain UAMH 10762) TaxID=717646 RepID=M2MLG4_BAUPA|nr:uncharacterized protein BAUCODRAFT_88360 [Baudoinia panamericana UAMH 10762]EMC97491.1 hypothetical protein BAUCODRAFT_88360 [Baudoinia panamericana UAMH 10762]
MGRYDFAPQRVHTYASQILHNSINGFAPQPPWFEVMGTVPPAERLTRPAMQRTQRPGKKASRLFQPLRLQYEEDRLRWEYFNDHPWELARPRVILEGDGRDNERWDWSVPLDHSLNRPRSGSIDDEGTMLDTQWDQTMEQQASRPINGEAVIQRQSHLIASGMQPSAAYDAARKEFYRHRHYNEIERRVAREEALSTGAFFGLGPLDVGMKLEDEAYKGWKVWAEKESAAMKALQGSAYTGQENDSVEISQPDQEELQAIGESVPASKRGQEARGGSAVHP